MINFTVGPVQIDNNILEIGAEQIPYFRTQEFSKTMLENEQMILDLSNAPSNSRVVFLTCSGTGSMEAIIINLFTINDKVLVVNGGSFGHRFVELLQIHSIPFDEIKLEYGQILTKDILDQYNNLGYTAFLINVHETSTGVLYDMDIVSSFCRNNGSLLVVDAISSFLADDFDMNKYNVDVMITSSQKALACPPGVSILTLSPKAIDIIMNNKSRCMYFDLKLALINGERGQTPFTPAVGILLQINSRLKQIFQCGGASATIHRTSQLAKYFRSNIKGLPLTIASESMSNAVTPIHPNNVSAYDVFINLKDNYNLWVCPNGGELKDIIFRVGHIGALSYADFDILIEALWDLSNKGRL